MATIRHHFLHAVVATLAFASVAACSSSDDGVAGAEVVESSVERQPAAPGAAVEGGAVARHVGASLYPVLAEEAGDANLAYSPASIAIAVAMSRAGAAGPSAEQFDEFLGTAPDDLHPAMNGLDAALAERSGMHETDNGREAEIVLEVVNSMWAQRGAQWEDPFLDTLKAQYGVGIHTVDYIDDAEGAREVVNGWLAKQTRDEIPDLIPEDTFKPSTRLTLVNALYLAAPWADELDPTDPLDFATAAGSTVSAPAMTATEERSYQQGDGWQSVAIPYAGGELAMTLLVPDAGRLADVEAQLTGDLLAQVLGEGESREVVLTMPKFDIESRPMLGDAMKELGVTAPFETTTDFRPMSEDPEVQPLVLADALHVATVTVDEKGTVAAAATATVFDQIGARIPDQPVELTVDRPFLFVVHDVETAAPLFIGRIADPTAP